MTDTPQTSDAAPPAALLDSTADPAPPHVSATSGQPPILDFPYTTLHERMAQLAQPGADKKRGFAVEFELVEQRSRSLAHDTTTASNPNNRAKNRYQNVLPHEETRVRLQVPDGSASSDYINASFISDASGKPAYIACQGPLEETTCDFWRMIWQENASVIVMLTRVFEIDRPKCWVYWPKRVDPVLQVGSEFCLRLVSSTAFQHYIVRKIVLERVGTSGCPLAASDFDVHAKPQLIKVERRTLLHIQYTAWPDYGAPPSSESFHEIRRLASHYNSPGAPIVVHCSAGLGRTGTFCVIDTILRRVREDLRTKIGVVTLNFVEAVLRCRAARANMVQTVEQYEFCYKAVADEIDRLVAEDAKIRLEDAACDVLPATDEYLSLFRTAATGGLSLVPADRQSVVGHNLVES